MAEEIDGVEIQGEEQSDRPDRTAGGYAVRCRRPRGWLAEVGHASVREVRVARPTRPRLSGLIFTRKCVTFRAKVDAARRRRRARRPPAVSHGHAIRSLGLHRRPLEDAGCMGEVVGAGPHAGHAVHDVEPDEIRLQGSTDERREVSRPHPAIVRLLGRRHVAGRRRVPDAQRDERPSRPSSTNI